MPPLNSFVRTCLALAIGQAVSQPVLSATLTVDSALDDDGAGCTLREAVKTINLGADQGNGCGGSDFGSNDTVNFDSPVLTNQKITLTKGSILIEKDLTIDGLGQSKLAVSGNNLSVVIRVSSADVTIRELTITEGRGDSGGAISVSHSPYKSANVTLADAKVSESLATFIGGGILVSGNQSHLELLDSTVSGNYANGRGGGGIGLQFSAKLTVTDSHITDNATDALGGGILALADTEIDLTNSIVSVNQAYSGGGIFIYDSDFSFRNSSMSNNSANRNGGGMVASDSAKAAIENSTISNNMAGRNGGGMIIWYSSDATLKDSTVSNNMSVRNGGGLNVYESTVKLTRSAIKNNNANRFAGGLYIGTSSEATLTDSTVSGNKAGLFGGGIEVYNDSKATIKGTTVSGNSAYNGGGGAFATASSEINLTNSTISGNKGAYGSGLYAYSGSKFTLNNVSVSGNKSSVGFGGIRAVSGSQFRLTNSILANSSGPDCSLVGSTVLDFGGNLVENDANNCETFLFEGVDPKLSSLKNHGGNTKTHALNDNSQAIDSGVASCPTTDQRGKSRDDGQCDIGAYEWREATAFSITGPISIILGDE